MKVMSEYYSDDSVKKAVITKRNYEYFVMTMNATTDKINEIDFDNLQDAEDYAEDYVMGVLQ